MNAAHARESLQQASDAQGYALRDLSLAWLPLVLYAGFAVVALTVPGGSVGRDTAGHGFLWIMAAPAVFAATALYAYQYRRERGIEGRPLAYVAVAFGLLTIAFAFAVVAFALGQPMLAQFGPSAVIAAGYALLARIERNGVFAVASAAVVAVTIGVAMLASDSGLTQWVLALLYVLILLVMRFGSSRRRSAA